MLSLHFFKILIRQLFSAFATQKTTSEQDNQYKIIRVEFCFLETQHSTIPLFSPRRRRYEPEAIIPSGA